MMARDPSEGLLYEGAQDTFEESRDSYDGHEEDEEFLDVEDHEDGTNKADQRKVGIIDSFTVT